MNITLRDIHKRFGDFSALEAVDLDIASGELLALLGPSGSGKTTLLRVIAGLEFPDTGRVCFDQEDIASKPIRERRVGFVFQHYALFRHMTVFDNVAFGLRVRPRAIRPAVSDIRARVFELLELVQLDGLAQRFPAQLSGGQRQRVALARALAIEPRVLLLDEPFGALDAKVRKELRNWLRDLQRKTGYTTVFVTHDQEEALELADRLVIMRAGRIEQLDTVDRVYEHPATPFVFDFLGGSNVLPATRQGRTLYLADAPLLELPAAASGDDEYDVYVRPGDLRIAGPGDAGLPVVIETVHRAGPVVHVTARLSHAVGHLLHVEVPHLHHDATVFTRGAAVNLRLMQYSIFPRAVHPDAGTPSASPVLIGRERARQAAR